MASRRQRKYWTEKLNLGKINLIDKTVRIIWIIEKLFVYFVKIKENQIVYRFVKFENLKWVYTIYEFIINSFCKIHIETKKFLLDV